MQRNDSRVPEVLQSYRNQSETPEQTLCSTEPIPLKRKHKGKYWFILSGVHPDNKTEIRTDVDQFADIERPKTHRPKMKYSDTISYPVNTGKLETVVNLLLLAYNYKNPKLYHDAGMAFGAQVNCSLMPIDTEIQAIKLRKLRHYLINGDAYGLSKWCLHEYPRTMEYLCDKNLSIFQAGLREAFERRWIHVPQLNPVFYRIEVE